MLRQRHQVFIALFGAMDAGVVTTACLIAWLFRRMVIEHSIPTDITTWIREPLVPVIVPIVFGGLWAFGVYRPWRNHSLWTEQKQLLKASTFSLGFAIVFLWTIGANAPATPSVVTYQIAGLNLDASRLQIGLASILTITMLSAFHLAARFTLRALRRRGRNQRHIAIVGVGRLGQIACRTLTRNTWTGLNVAFFLSHEAKTTRETCLNRPVLGGLDDLEKVLEEKKIDGLYLALPNSEAAQLPDLLKRLERFALDVRIIPDVPLRYMPQRMAVSDVPTGE